MILAINTSTPQFSLALLREDETVLGECALAGGKDHLRNLMPALDFLFSGAQCRVRDLKALVVAIGPGSFTGLRIGLAAAKGLCHALQTPIIGISSLEALASQLPCADFPIAPVLDSRKGEVFTALFAWDNALHLSRYREDISLKLEDLPSLFESRTRFIGNDFRCQATAIKQTLRSQALLAPAHCWNLKASAVGSLGLKRYSAHDFDDPVNLSPVYLRPPDIRPAPFQPTPV